jgi:hypothetical protein
LIGGVLIALCALGLRSSGRGYAVPAGMLAAVMAVIAIVDHQEVNSRVSEVSEFAAAGVGIGIWTIYVGVVFALLGAVSGYRSPQPDRPTQTRECPHCKEQMRRDASVCPQCRRESAAWTFHDGYWWVKRDTVNFYLDEKKNQWVQFSGSRAATATVPVAATATRRPPPPPPAS